MMQQPDDFVQSPFGGKTPEIGSGRVFLVGAGPGAPDLITVRGRKCLQIADFVLYDGLANQSLLAYAPQATHISVGKHGHLPFWKQSEIHEKMLELARAGHTVVRLKGGDPAIFARTAEELKALHEANIPFEVIPGITAALAASSYVGIPLTHRDHASAVALVTGQQRSDELPLPIDWEALARFPGTLVFYMGVTTADEWTGQLMAAGKAPTTPAAIVRRCTWQDQSIIRCTLQEVAPTLTPASRMRPPVIVVVGDVAALGAEYDWFSRQPLHGCGVLLPRAESQNNAVAERLFVLGATIFSEPAIDIGPPNSLTQLDHAIEGLAKDKYTAVAFSSANGVRAFCERVFECGYDARIFRFVKTACVGQVTADSLRQYGLSCDIVPDRNCEASANGLLQTFGFGKELHALPLREEHWLVVGTNRSKPILKDGLRALGATVNECIAYETNARTTLSEETMFAAKRGDVHFALLTSSVIAEATASMLGDLRKLVRPVCLSHAIGEKVAELDWHCRGQPIIAPLHSIDAMIEEMIKAWNTYKESVAKDQ